MAALSADMYTIINQKSGTCLAVSGVDGTTVIGEARNDEPNQKWKVELVGDGLFDMRNVLNGYFLSFVRGGMYAL
ncbi:hypothetical protein PENSUB_4607 [Penicillium subrubescens]|uniref:Ricin B lectin domain-containing protein n=1 Tax=Penicillium subrubescens TaxID=1316194 RepID=A0A1Q5UBX7_9EURO|nr:hypothetical protein PENSUB_4607 [Penicillium subrubescens]